MAAPYFVQASTGTTDASGTFTFTGVATGTIGDIVILQILNDGTGVISWGTLTNSNINKLDGTAGWDEIGIFFAGAAAQQRLFIGRRTSASSAPTFTASANTSGDDVYGRMYEFHNVSTGTALATVIENWPGAAVITQASGASHGAFGQSGGNPALAGQSFTAVTGSISGVALTLTREGVSDPGDGVVVEIQTDSAGVPSGTVLATSAALPWASMTATSVSYDFKTVCDLTSGSSYWIVARRTGTLSATANYNWDFDGGGASVYAGGVFATKTDAGAWTTVATRDRVFTVYGIPSTSGVTTSNTASDAAVTTLGPDRLALNFVGVNDDNAISAFTGETGGDWTLAVAPYADSGGTDGAIGLQAGIPGGNIQADNGLAAGTGFGLTGNQQTAESFVAQGNATSVATWLWKGGAPTDDAVIEVQTDSGGSPSGSVVGSTTVAGTSLTTAATWMQLALSLSLSAGTTYWLVFRRSGALNNTNYYRVGGAASNVWAGGACKIYDGAAWGADLNLDHAFAIIPSGTGTIDGGTGSIVDSDAWGVVGFALIGTTPTPPTTRQPRNPAVNFQDPAYV